MCILGAAIMLQFGLKLLKWCLHEPVCLDARFQDCEAHEGHTACRPCQTPSTFHRHACTVKTRAAPWLAAFWVDRMAHRMLVKFYYWSMVTRRSRDKNLTARRPGRYELRGFSACNLHSIIEQNSGQPIYGMLSAVEEHS